MNRIHWTRHVEIELYRVPRQIIKCTRDVRFIYCAVLYIVFIKFACLACKIRIFVKIHSNNELHNKYMKLKPVRKLFITFNTL